MTKIERLPGVRSTPLILLHKLLEDVEKIESLVVTVEWKSDDGTTSHGVHWTAQRRSTLALASIATQQVIAGEIMEQGS